VSSGREESFLTVAEVAEWLKLNQQTVRNWIDQGSLPAVRVGRRVRIKQSDLDRILAQGYQGPAPEPVRSAGPSADDFWSGEPVGMAEPAPAGAAAAAARAEPAPAGAAAAPARAESVAVGAAPAAEGAAAAEPPAATPQGAEIADERAGDAPPDEALDETLEGPQV
jgi:excisionase family DNA binding protein